MIRDLALAAKASCSREDQESLVEIVLQLKKLSKLVTKQGLLALENESNGRELLKKVIIREGLLRMQAGRKLTKKRAYLHENILRKS